jgi:hypothetical protein
VSIHASEKLFCDLRSDRTYASTSQEKKICPPPSKEWEAVPHEEGHHTGVAQESVADSRLQNLRKN